jgi:hypothetical protein
MPIASCKGLAAVVFLPPPPPPAAAAAAAPSAVLVAVAGAEEDEDEDEDGDGDGGVPAKTCIFEKHSAEALLHPGCCCC